MEPTPTKTIDVARLRKCFVRLDKSVVERWSQRQVGINKKGGQLCHVCEKVFRSEVQLRAHFKVHQGQKPFLCVECGKSFWKRISLDEHQAKVHDKGGFRAPREYTECPVCQVRVISLYHHLKTHTSEKPHKCQYCPKKFTQRGHRRQHENAIHRPTRHKCSFCEKTYASQAYKDKHEKSHGGTCEPQVYCELCSLRFYSEGELVKHVRRHTGEKPFKCKYCVATFRVPGSARAHERRTHENNWKRNFDCRFCDKLLTTSQGRRQHEMVQHQGIGFPCKYCNKLLQSQCTRAMHERQVHTGEKNFACSYCPKAFSTKTYCNIHMRSHTGEKPFKCDQCNMSFTRSTILKYHKVSAHPKTQRERLECCRFCDKRFFTQNALQSHLRTHTGEKPFHCKFCDRPFADLRNCGRHEKRRIC